MRRREKRAARRPEETGNVTSQHQTQAVAHAVGARDAIAIAIGISSLALTADLASDETATVGVIVGEVAAEVVTAEAGVALVVALVVAHALGSKGAAEVLVVQLLGDAGHVLGAVPQADNVVNVIAVVTVIQVPKAIEETTKLRSF